MQSEKICLEDMFDTYGISKKRLKLFMRIRNGKLVNEGIGQSIKNKIGVIVYSGLYGD
jgi:hypothetical protein